MQFKVYFGKISDPELLSIWELYSLENNVGRNTRFKKQTKKSTNHKKTPTMSKHFYQKVVMFTLRECQLWLLVWGQRVFVFETTAQTGNILQHSGALQYWPCMHYTRRQAHVLVTKTLALYKIPTKVKSAITFQSLNKQHSLPPPFFVLYLGHLGQVSVHFLCNSCIRYVSLPQVCFLAQHSVDTAGGVKPHEWKNSHAISLNMQRVHSKWTNAISAKPPWSPEYWPGWFSIILQSELRWNSPLKCQLNSWLKGQ